MAGRAGSRRLKQFATVLVQPRGGLGHVLAKLRAGEPVKIAYLGGSITAAAGWRVMSREWFQKGFPRAKVSEIQAAIGGTGSDLGVFRLKADVLQHQPDLMFVEFAVNDGNTPPPQIWRSMEGIVRQTWTALPATDICFVYTFAVGHEKELQEGRCPPAAAAMEQLAAHYGIPSINVALKVVQEQRAGKLIYQSDHPTGPGVVQFSTDGVHPLAQGHQLYTDVIAAAVTEIAKQRKPAGHGAALAATPFVADHWQSAKAIPVSQAMLSPEWKRVDPEAIPFKFFRERLNDLEATKPGSKLSFKFRGSLVKLFDILGPDGGCYRDRGRRPEPAQPVPRFDVSVPIIDWPRYPSPRASSPMSCIRWFSRCTPSNLTGRPSLPV